MARAGRAQPAFLAGHRALVAGAPWKNSSRVLDTNPPDQWRADALAFRGLSDGDEEPARRWSMEGC